VKPSSEGNSEAVDAGYIANLLADDWGFWYEATQNLGKTRQLLGRSCPSSDSPDQAARIKDGIASIEAAVESVPKGRHLRGGRSSARRALVFAKWKRSFVRRPRSPGR